MDAIWGSLGARNSHLKGSLALPESLLALLGTLLALFGALLAGFGTHMCQTMLHFEPWRWRPILLWRCILVPPAPFSPHTPLVSEYKQGIQTTVGHPKPQLPFTPLLFTHFAVQCAHACAHHGAGEAAHTSCAEFRGCFCAPSLTHPFALPAQLLPHHGAGHTARTRGAESVAAPVHQLLLTHPR